MLKKRALIVLFAFAGILFLQWSLMLPPLYKENVRAWNSCWNNLRQIDSAKSQWAEDNDLWLGAEVVVDEVSNYIKGHVTPDCSRDGVYFYNAIGTPAACSLGKPKLRRVRLSFRQWEWQEVHVDSDSVNY